MLERHVIDLAKRRMFEGRYGKFDWVEKLIDGNDLLNLKPRMIIQQIALKLMIEVDKIPYQTFYSWLKVFRKSQLQKLKDADYPERSQDLNGNINIDDRDMSWKTFKPSIPINDNLVVKEPILKTVEYDQ